LKEIYDILIEDALNYSVLRIIYHLVTNIITILKGLPYSFIKYKAILK